MSSDPFRLDGKAAVVTGANTGLGQAIAEAIFGLYNPSGQLPMTVPRSAGHLGSFYNHLPSAYHRGKFRFSSTAPLFEFGHGLSYTTFEYRSLQAKKELASGEALAVDVELENTGERTGDEVVLLYVQDVYASVTRPVKALKGFQRVSLQPHEKKVVHFELPAEAFALLDRNLEPAIEPGEFRLSVGPGALEHSVWVR